MSYNPFSNGTYNSTPPTLTNGQVAPVELDVNGNQKVVLATTPTVTVGNASIAVTGTVAVTGAYQATQPVSAVSLPLPSGASTAAKQPAPGTAGTPSTDVITVQGAASMTALKVDGSAVTQPVSGTVTATISGYISNSAFTSNQGSAASAGSAWPTYTTVSGVAVDPRSIRALTSSDQVTVANSSIAVTGTFYPATQPVSGTMTVNAGTGTFTTADAHAYANGSTTSGQSGFLELAAVTTTAPTYTTAQSAPLSLTTAGALRVDASATTQPVSLASAVAANIQSSGTALTNTGGALNVNVTGSASASATGSAVPASADYMGFYSSGNLVGVSATNPMPVSVGSAVTVSQSTAASLNATVVGTGTFTVQAVQSGTWNVGTITTLPALVAGAANIGSVNLALAGTAVSATAPVPISATAAANSVTNAIYDRITDGTSSIGLMTNFGTTPGAVKALAVNASLAVGTTQVSAAAPVPISATAAANTAANPIYVSAAPATTGGLSAYSGSVGATATAVKASAGQMYGYHLVNNTAAIAYVQVFNVATGSVTLGTTVPTMVIPLPGNSTTGAGATFNTDIGIAFSSAITIACTTTRGGSTAATVDCLVYYK